MIKLILSFLLIAVLFLPVSAVDIVSKTEIDSLIEEDDAVVLDETVICKLKSKNRIEYFYSVKVLIKNNKAEGYGSVHLGESEYVEVDDIKGRLTDILGNEIKILRKKDITESSMSSYSSYNHDKTKSFKLFHAKFPYIIEYSYKLNIESLFFWPGWVPQSDIPALKSSYKLVQDHPYPFKTYSIGLNIQPEKSVEDGDSVYYWLAENIPARADEDFLPPENKVQMALLFAPEYFELSGTSGSTKSWKELGKWSWGLNKDRFDLPQEAQAEIKGLVEGLTDTYEIIRVLYKYLQSLTRYVAIEIDIGGWQPYPAKETYKNKYGDCKDLSTLMVAMLRVAGIEAYTADARMRDTGEVIKEFPSSQFNHVIAFVPLENDTLWLECTADFIDIHDMPYNIEDINALVIKEDGGELIHTPTAPSSRNKWVSSIKADLNCNLKSIFVDSKINVSGKFKNNFKRFFEIADSEDEKIVLQKMFSEYVPNLAINQYEFDEVGDKVKNICLKFDGEYKKSFAKTGSRIFINPNFFNRKTSSNIPDEKVEDRKYPIHFNYPYQDIDSVEIKIPNVYQLEAAPEPLLIDNSFARYETKYKYENQQLYYVRTFEYKTNHFAKELYGEFVEFLKTVIKNDDAKFVFKK